MLEIFCQPRCCQDVGWQLAITKSPHRQELCGMNSKFHLRPLLPPLKDFAFVFLQKLGNAQIQTYTLVTQEGRLTYALCICIYVCIYTFI